MKRAHTRKCINRQLGMYKWRYGDFVSFFLQMTHSEPSLMSSDVSVDHVRHGFQQSHSVGSEMSAATTHNSKSERSPPVRVDRRISTGHHQGISTGQHQGITVIQLAFSNVPKLCKFTFYQIRLENSICVILIQ